MLARLCASIPVLVLLSSAAVAQPKAPPEKISPRPIQPTQRPAPLPESRQPLGALNELPPLVYSQWAKFCGRDRYKPQAGEVCLTVREARLETGQFVAGAALIEQPGEEKKLRVTMPLGMRLMPGVRVAIDSDPPLIGPYFLCIPSGCMADFEANADLIDRLKKGKELRLHGVNTLENPAVYLLPLGGFAQANEAPPTDPTAYEREQLRQGAPPSNLLR